MTSFTQVHHFVDNHVFQAPHWLLHELEVQPDPVRIRVAASPACLHPLDPHFGDRSAHSWLPLREQRGEQCSQLASVPALQDCIPLVSVVARGHAKLDGRMAYDPNGGRPAALLYGKSIAAPLEELAFPGDHLPLRLPILSRELFLL